MNLARIASQASRSSTSFQKNEVPVSGGFPAPLSWPMSKGRNVVAGPSSLVVIATRVSVTTKCTRAPRNSVSSGSLRGERSVRYWAMPFSRLWV